MNIVESVAKRATRSPWPTPRSRSPVAARLTREFSSAKVSVSSSVAGAGLSGVHSAWLRTQSAPLLFWCPLISARGGGGRGRQSRQHLGPEQLDPAHHLLVRDVGGPPVQ